MFQCLRFGTKITIQGISIMNMNVIYESYEFYKCFITKCKIIIFCTVRNFRKQILL